MQDWFRGWSAVRPKVNVKDPGGPETHFLAWNWDFQKAFDHVDRGRLWKEAVE